MSSSWPSLWQTSSLARAEGRAAAGQRNSMANMLAWCCCLTVHAPRYCTSAAGLFGQARCPLSASPCPAGGHGPPPLPAPQLTVRCMRNLSTAAWLREQPPSLHVACVVTLLPVPPPPPLLFPLAACGQGGAAKARRAAGRHPGGGAAAAPAGPGAAERALGDRADTGPAYRAGSRQPAAAARRVGRRGGGSTRRGAARACPPAGGQAGRRHPAQARPGWTERGSLGCVRPGCQPGSGTEHVCWLTFSACKAPEEAERQGRRARTLCLRLVRVVDAPAAVRTGQRGSRERSSDSRAPPAAQLTAFCLLVLRAWVVMALAPASCLGLQWRKSRGMGWCSTWGRQPTAGGCAFWESNGILRVEMGASRAAGESTRSERRQQQSRRTAALTAECEGSKGVPPAEPLPGLHKRFWKYLRLLGFCCCSTGKPCPLPIEASTVDTVGEFSQFIDQIHSHMRQTANFPFQTDRASKLHAATRRAVLC